MTIDRRTFLAMLPALIWPATVKGAELPLVALPGSVEAPDFAIADLSGTVHHLSRYRGRPVLVAFWAVWCAPCRREISELAELRARLKDTGIEVIAINLGDSDERVAAFLKDHPAPGLPVLLDREKLTAVPWHVRGLPVAYGVGPDGILRLGALGERDWHAPAVETQLRALL